MTKIFAGISRRAVVTLTLVVGLTLAFAYAMYLSYWASQGLDDAFQYQSLVVDAERDADVLAVEQYDEGASPQELKPYTGLIRRDLATIDAAAQSPEERAPALTIPGSRLTFNHFRDELVKRQDASQVRFQHIVARNEATRDLSNAMFALVALLFALLVGRLRRTIEEGRSLVEHLQRAFISTRRSIPGIDLGSVLISATRGSNVGGDTHDALTLDRKHALFLVADVSGKGIDAAVDTALIKYTMRTLFSEETDPGRLLEKFSTIYERTAENPETFVVLFVAVVDLADGTVRYASAGHEPAWAVCGGAVETLPPTGPIVGIENDAGYGTRSLRLAPGDAIVISTDGLTESRDARGTFLGAEGVRAWLAEITGSAQARADAVVRRLRRRSRRVTDDLAILVVRYEPSVAPVPDAVAAPPAAPALSSP